jgi:myo-inositol 2-dehydrogenase / D-chiro-inositol 1-dehydrogenase
MNRTKKTQTRREFMGNAAGIGILGAIGTGYLLSSCAKRQPAPVFYDRAPDGPLLKAGLIGCGGRGTGAAINFLRSGPNLQITALGDIFQHSIDNCRKTLKERAG